MLINSFRYLMNSDFCFLYHTSSNFSYFSFLVTKLSVYLKVIFCMSVSLFILRPFLHIYIPCMQSFSLCCWSISSISCWQSQVDYLFLGPKCCSLIKWIHKQCISFYKGASFAVMLIRPHMSCSRNRFIWLPGDLLWKRRFNEEY